MRLHVHGAAGYHLNSYTTIDTKHYGAQKGSLSEEGTITSKEQNQMFVADSKHFRPWKPSLCKRLPCKSSLSIRQRRAPAPKAEAVLEEAWGWQASRERYGRRLLDLRSSEAKLIQIDFQILPAINEGGQLPHRHSKTLNRGEGGETTELSCSLRPPLLYHHRFVRASPGLPCTIRYLYFP